MAELPKEAYALLETIAGPESSGQYDVIYGGSKFGDYSDHPRQYVTITSGPNKGQKSSAAGKYQFLGSTWDDQAQKLGLTDFSPASQDAAAWNLAQEEYKRDTGRDLLSDLQAGDTSRVTSSLRNQWTSMPGGIEQGITGSAFANAYAAALGNPSPAVNAINQAAPSIKPAVAKDGNWWSNPMGTLTANIGGIMGSVAPQTQAPDFRKSLMNAAMSSLPVRTAFVKSLMNQNIGEAPSVSEGHVSGGSPVTAINSSGSRPVTLMNPSNPGSSAFDRDVHAGQDMNVYRANREAVGDRLTQSNIERALSGGSTLYRR